MAYDGGSSPTLAEQITRKWVPEMFSKQIIEHTRSDLVVANAFTHKYTPDLRLGYKVSIPATTEASVTEVTPGTEPTISSTSTTAQSITIDQWFESTVEISPLIQIEELPSYMASGAMSAAYAIDKKIDTTVGARHSALGGSTYPNADGDAFTDDTFISLVETLDENDVPARGRFLIGDPSTKADMLKIDKFVRMDYINGSPTTNGQFGQLYDAKVLITNNLTGATTGNFGVYAHPDAIGVVLQKNPNSNLYNLGWKFIVRIIVDAAWGSNELRDTFGKAFYTRKNP